jgi:hypothetical protein
MNLRHFIDLIEEAEEERLKIDIKQGKLSYGNFHGSQVIR